MVQLAPEYPLAHVHRKPGAGSTRVHVPPLIHGEGLHGVVGARVVVMGSWEVIRVEASWVVRGTVDGATVITVVAPLGVVAGEVSSPEPASVVDWHEQRVANKVNNKRRLTLKSAMLRSCSLVYSKRVSCSCS